MKHEPANAARCKSSGNLSFKPRSPRLGFSMRVITPIFIKYTNYIIEANHEQ